jgi:toxin YoeB
MRDIVFAGKTFEKYEDIRNKNKTLHNKLIKILKEMQKNNPEEGLGMPEPLKHQYSGCWSRRISKRDRVIYKFDEKNIYILALGGHYDSN